MKREPKCVSARQASASVTWTFMQQCCVCQEWCISMMSAMCIRMHSRCLIFNDQEAVVETSHESHNPLCSRRHFCLVLTVTTLSCLQREYERQTVQLTELIQIINGELPPNDRKQLITMCTIDVHARDVVRRFVSLNKSTQLTCVHALYVECSNTDRFLE